jgi:hypothetical protein
MLCETREGARSGHRRLLNQATMDRRPPHSDVGVRDVRITDIMFAHAAELVRRPHTGEPQPAFTHLWPWLEGVRRFGRGGNCRSEKPWLTEHRCY